MQCWWLLRRKPRPKWKVSLSFYRLFWNRYISVLKHRRSQGRIYRYWLWISKKSWRICGRYVLIRRSIDWLIDWMNDWSITNFDWYWWWNTSAKGGTFFFFWKRLTMPAIAAWLFWCNVDLVLLQTTDASPHPPSSATGTSVKSDSSPQPVASTAPTTAPPRHLPETKPTGMVNNSGGVPINVRRTPAVSSMASVVIPNGAASSSSVLTNGETLPNAALPCLKFEALPSGIQSGGDPKSVALLQGSISEVLAWKRSPSDVSDGKPQFLVRMWVIVYCFLSSGFFYL